MAQNKEFIVSVANVKGYNPSTGAFMFSAETLLESAMSVSMSSQEIRGGFGNMKVFEYFHSRTMEVTMNSATWEIDYLALNVGKTIANGTDTVYKFDECMALTAGAGTTAAVPVGNVFVKKPNGAVVEIVPSGSTFTVPGLTNETVFVTYRTSTTVDKLVIDASSSPTIVKLVMQAKIFDATGQIGTLEIEVPRFQISGNFELSLTAEGVVSTPISGMALAYADGTCAGGSQYATVRIIPVNGTTEGLAAIASSPSPMNLSAGTPTGTISTYAIPSGVRSNYLVANSACTYVSANASFATVASTGVVSRVATGTTYVTITHTASGLKDTVTVVCA